MMTLLLSLLHNPPPPLGSSLHTFPRQPLPPSLAPLSRPPQDSFPSPSSSPPNNPAAAADFPSSNAPSVPHLARLDTPYDSIINSLILPLFPFSPQPPPLKGHFIMVSSCCRHGCCHPSLVPCHSSLPLLHCLCSMCRDAPQKLYGTKTFDTTKVNQRLHHATIHRILNVLICACSCSCSLQQSTLRWPWMWSMSLPPIPLSNPCH